MRHPHKYARIERERRFLVDRFPSGDIVRTRHITDRYIDGTLLRLREQTDEGVGAIFKLTQKVPVVANGAQQGLITTIYLTEGEFRLLSQLPGKMLSKVRYSVPPLGIDVFEGTLEGLRLAEAEFNSAAEADAFVLPDFVLHEVTGDVRFTGGQLVCASRLSVEKWLAEYGITLSEPRLRRSPRRRSSHSWQPT
jgi:CYTH domain-containing protein